MRKNRRQLAEDQTEKLYLEGMSLKINHVLCPVCLITYREPAYLNCGHTFCESCIKKCPPTCPICRSQIDKGSIKKDLLMKKIVDRLEVKCNNQYCSWVGESGQVDSHLKICLFNPEYNIKKLIRHQELAFENPQQEVDNELKAFLQNNLEEMKESERKLQKAFGCKLTQLQLSSLKDEDLVGMDDEFRFLVQTLTKRIDRGESAEDYGEVQKFFRNKRREIMIENRQIVKESTRNFAPRIELMKKIIQTRIKKPFTKTIYLKTHMNSNKKETVPKRNEKERFLSNEILMKLTSENQNEAQRQSYENYVQNYVKKGDEIAAQPNNIGIKTNKSEPIEKQVFPNKYGKEGRKEWTKNISYFKKLVNHKIPRSHFPMQDLSLLVKGMSMEAVKIFEEFKKVRTNEDHQTLMNRYRNDIQAIEAVMTPTIEACEGVFDKFINNDKMTLGELEGLYRQYLNQMRQGAN